MQYLWSAARWSTIKRGMAVFKSILLGDLSKIMCILHMQAKKLGDLMDNINVIILIIY